MRLHAADPSSWDGERFRSIYGVPKQIFDELVEECKEHPALAGKQFYSVLERLRAAPAASDKAASFPARGRTVPVQESSWHPLGMPLPAVRGAKHSCATTAEVKILHWGPSHVEIPSPHLCTTVGYDLTNS
jgi:hypothetical protein